MRIALLLAFAAIAGGQLRFEVASVRPADPDHEGRKAYRTDPPNIILERESLLRLISVAYGLDWDQIAGPPWIASTYYSVNAKAPEGTTPETLKSMWQALLADRFHLKARFVPKDFDVWELSVVKSNPKLRTSAGPVAPSEKRSISVSPPRNVKLTFRDFTMKEFAGTIWTPLGAPASEWDGCLSVARVVDNIPPPTFLAPSSSNSA